MKRAESAPAAARARRVEQPHKAALLARLNRIEGQVRGVAAMIEQDRYCIDVLTQIAAARSALDAVSLRLLQDHTRRCVRAAIQSGDDDRAIAELMKVMAQLTR